MTLLEVIKISMADPVSKPKPFGDAALARKLLEAYVDGVVPLTEKECKGLGISTDYPDNDCFILSGCIDPLFDRNNFNFRSKEEILSQSGFSEEFIRALTGPDADRALQARARWLADHLDLNVLFDISRFSYNPEREKTLQIWFQLRNLGSHGMPVFPSLLPRLKTMVEEMPWRKGMAMEIAAAIEWDGSTRAEHLAQFCQGKKGGLGDLIVGLLSKDKEEKKCAARALELMLGGGGFFRSRKGGGADPPGLPPAPGP